MRLPQRTARRAMQRPSGHAITMAETTAAPAAMPSTIPTPKYDFRNKNIAFYASSSSLHILPGSAAVRRRFLLPACLRCDHDAAVPQGKVADADAPGEEVIHKPL